MLTILVPCFTLSLILIKSTNSKLVEKIIVASFNGNLVKLPKIILTLVYFLEIVFLTAFL